MPCDLNLFCCQEFNIKAFFSSSNRKKKKDVLTILDSIESMQDFMFNKKVVINVILQKIKKLLGCEYYILHKLDSKRKCIKPNAVILSDIEEYKKFLHYKSSLYDSKINLKDEEAIMNDYIQSHGSDGNSLNYVSSSFIDNCDRKFIEKYIKDEAMICSTNFNSTDNIFGHVISTNKYFISDNIYNEDISACRMPDGHPSIKSFMCIPFANHNGVVYAIAGFANSNRKLRHKDYKLILPILKSLNNILPSLLE